VNILLVGNYLDDEQQSMIRFSHLLFTQLMESGYKVKLIRPKSVLGRHLPPGTLKKYIGYIDKFILFPFALRRASVWADVVHICDHSNASYYRHVLERPHVVTCHDLVAISQSLNHWPEVPLGWTGKVLQKWIAANLKSAQFLACDSHATLEECHSLLGISRAKLEVVYLGLNFPFTRLTDEYVKDMWRSRGLKIPGPYLIHVGSNGWYKNRLGLIDIFSFLIEQRDIYLVIAGERLTPFLEGILEARGLTSRVIQLGGLSNEELAALYSGAAGLLFPSLIEGFGWPPLEAQACGCPVFASNRAPMPEICGDGAVYFDPMRPLEAAMIIDENLDDTTAMQLAGYENVARFDASTMRDQYLAIYSRLVNQV
jgi:glycosyltransferase involved in cell wall biosynthesis